MRRRIGVVGIVIEDRAKAPEINNILSQHSAIIVGRMGIPNVRQDGCGPAVIALIVDGTNEEIGALTGKLGKVRGVQVRSALSREKGETAIDVSPRS